MKSAGTAKIRGFDTFSECKSRGGVHRVSHGSPLKMSSRTRLYGGYICQVKRYASVIRNQWGERIQILKFSTYYETAKFTGDQSELLGKLK